VVPGADRRPLAPLDTCLVEVFRDTGVVDVATNNPYFALLRLTRDLRLLDLADSRWITVAGGNAAISSGRRSQAREWARAIYRHYGGSEAPDGLFYSCSNMPNGRSVALFERSRNALSQHPALDLPLAHPGLWADVEYACTELGLDLVYHHRPVESPFKSDSTSSNMCGVTLKNNQVGVVVAEVMCTQPGVKVTHLPSMIRLDADTRMDFVYDDLSDALGEEEGFFDSAEFEENMSTHYGRMIHEDDRTIMFPNPEDAAEYIGFDLPSSVK